MSEEKSVIVKMVKTYTEQIIDDQVCLRHKNGNVYLKSSFENLINEVKQKGGVVRAEFGCPPAGDYSSEDERLRRIFTVDDSRVCGEINVDTIVMEGTTITADVTPVGPFMNSLLELSQPQFGIRAVCDIKHGGVRELKNFITFDLIDNGEGMNFIREIKEFES